MLVVATSARVVAGWLVGAAPIVVGIWRAAEVGEVEGNTRVEVITVVDGRNTVVGGAVTVGLVMGSEEDVGNALTGVETVVVTWALPGAVGGACALTAGTNPMPAAPALDAIANAINANLPRRDRATI